jgi:hypothetical protein
MRYLLKLLAFSCFFVGYLQAVEPSTIQDIDEILKTYSTNRPSTPTFSGQWFSLNPKRIELQTKNELVVQDIHTVWDVSKFLRPRTPARIETLENRALFDLEGVPRCIHLPIKFPNSELRIPVEYEQFSEALQKILDHEYSANPHYREYYAYLTIDQSFVPRQSYQRVPGPHVDGIPRDRDNPQTVIDHAYMVTNTIPTLFYIHPFDMSKYDLKKHNFFVIFRALADEYQTITPAAYDISLMNAYSVHTPTTTNVDVHRTFLRLEFSVLEFDRIGNSINSAFADDDHYPNYPFDYIPRSIPKELTIPVDIFEDRPVSNFLYTIQTLDEYGRDRLNKFIQENPRATLYKSIEKINHQVSSKNTKGFVILRNAVPQGLALFEEENTFLKLNVLYTFPAGISKELFIYALKKAKDLHTSKHIVFVEDSNNKEMIKYFERAAWLAQIPYFIQRLTNPSSGF